MSQFIKLQAPYLFAQGRRKKKTPPKPAENEAVTTTMMQAEVFIVFHSTTETDCVCSAGKAK